MTFFLYNNRAFFDSHLKAGNCMGAHMHYRMFHAIILYYESSLNLGAIKNSIIALISRHLAYQVGGRMEKFIRHWRLGVLPKGFLKRFDRYK